jgi:hypothetical protein
VSARDAAVQAAGRGWYVFPVRPGGKEPRRALSWPAAATCDPAAVADARWQAGENYGVAAKRSGLVILDLDMPKDGYQLPPQWDSEPGITDGKDVLAALADRNGVTQWPCTCTVRTPSGGWHLYFTAPAGRPIGNRPLGPMVDVRGGGTGNGGYVLGPGSVLNGRRYEFTDSQDPQPLPGWIADLLDPPRPEGPATMRMPPAQPGRYADAALRSELQAVLASRQPGRNNTLNEAAFSLGQLVAAGTLDRGVVEPALLRAAEAVGLPAAEAGRTVMSGLNAGAQNPRRAA